ncbi:MAG TPA: HIT domain-containing protein [Victivallales bacterium]|nr:HIT domain-containing protein [Victivallales bacterium]
MKKKNQKTSFRPLWAPWRIEYIISEKDGSCFLCDRKKKGGNDECMIIHRGKTAFVVMNMYPYNSGHMMIAPYRHVATYSALTDKERMEISALLVKAEKTLSRVMRPEGFNIGFNIGKAAGAGVEEHIHMHIVPRWQGDNNFMPVLGDIRVVPQALEKTAEIIRQNWS